MPASPDTVDEQANAAFHQTVPCCPRPLRPAGGSGGGPPPTLATLGIDLLHNAKDEVRGRIAWRESLCTGGDTMHGGVLMALADTTGAVCAFLNLPPGSSGTTTIESKTNILRAVRSGHRVVPAPTALRAAGAAAHPQPAISRPLHTGRRIVVVETDIVDDEHRLVARVTQSQLVRASGDRG